MDVQSQTVFRNTVDLIECSQLPLSSPMTRTRTSGCTHGAPKAVTLNVDTPRLLISTGDAKRSAPTGGWANGIPI